MQRCGPSGSLCLFPGHPAGRLLGRGDGSMLAPRVEKGHRKLGELPASEGHDKVEIWTRTAEEGGEVLELVEYAWGSGLGWYVQKRMTLDAAQVDALRALLIEDPAKPAQIGRASCRER